MDEFFESKKVEFYVDENSKPDLKLKDGQVWENCEYIGKLERLGDFRLIVFRKTDMQFVQVILHKEDYMIALLDKMQFKLTDKTLVIEGNDD